MTFSSAKKLYKRLEKELRRRSLSQERREELKAYRRELENQFGPSLREAPVQRKKRTIPSSSFVVIVDEGGHEVDRLSLTDIKSRGSAYQEILKGLTDAIRIAARSTPRRSVTPSEEPGPSERD
jgi:hypothetical protein